MLDTRLSDERLEEMVKWFSSDPFPGNNQDAAMALRELQTSRASISELEGIVKEMAPLLEVLLDEYAKTFNTLPKFEMGMYKTCEELLNRPSVQSILARGK